MESPGPFHQAAKEGQNRVPSLGVRGWGTRAEKVPTIEAASGTMQEDGAPPGSRARRSAPSKTRELWPSGFTLGDQGPPRGKQRPPAPGPTGPAGARVPGLLGIGPWRLQPQRARLVGVESVSGRFLHGPPLWSRPGSRPPPLAGWSRHRVRLRH